MNTHKNLIEVCLNIPEDIYDFYKLRANRKGTDIDTQLILTFIESMNADQLSDKQKEAYNR
jgi:hypothetical protein